MTSRLCLQDIRLKAGDFRLELNLDVQLGSLGVFGPSGSGKTTLLEIIAGLRRPHTGRIELDGVPVMDRASDTWLPAHCRNVGYVPQDLALFPHLNVRRNIAYGVRNKVDHPNDDIPAFDEVLGILELTSLLRRRPGSLSGGEKQRVAIARALAAQPRILLLDEPLTGLDQDRRDSVLHYLKLLRQKWTVPMIYVSHQADEIALLCDEVVILCEGRVAGRGSPRDLFEISARPSFRLRRELGTPSEGGHVSGG